VKGGILDGELLSQSQVESLADMPPREVVMAQLLGLIQQPGNQAAFIVNAVGSKLAATLKAYADQLQSSEAAA
jgi:large subunit ribosomal protein L10